MRSRSLARRGTYFYVYGPGPVFQRQRRYDPATLDRRAGERRTAANAAPPVQSKGDVSTLQPFRLERRANAEGTARYCSDEEAFIDRPATAACAIRAPNWQDCMIGPHT